MRCNVMCTNDENPHLIDTKMYLLHVECHVRDAATDLVVHLDNTNNTALQCFGNGKMPRHIIG